VRKGLTEAEVQRALGDLDEHCPLDPAVKAALRLSDVLVAPGATIDESLAAELRQHYDDTQILELGAALAVGSGWQRMIEAFGIRPDSWVGPSQTPGVAAGS